LAEVGQWGGIATPRLLSSAVSALKTKELTLLISGLFGMALAFA
jgi:hypothetical protein